MSRWTDNPASQEPETRPSRLRRSLAWVSALLSGKLASAAILIRAGIAFGLVGLLTVGLMIQGRSAKQEPAPQVKIPSFETVPVVRREATAPRISPSVSPFLSPTASLPMGQRFLPGVRTSAEGFCTTLAGIGFTDAKWEPSQVFANEWECSAPLRIDGEDQSTAFLVARGRRADSIGSLMLRLNPANENERPMLETLATKVRDAFAVETGLLLPEQASDLVERWATGEVAGIGGRMRLVNDRAKPGSLVINLMVQPRLAADPAYRCEAKCSGRMRALAKTAETRSVKSQEP